MEEKRFNKTLYLATKVGELPSATLTVVLSAGKELNKAASDEHVIKFDYYHTVYGYVNRRNGVKEPVFERKVANDTHLLYNLEIYESQLIEALEEADRFHSAEVETELTHRGFTHEEDEMIDLPSGSRVRLRSLTVQKSEFE